MLLRTKMCRQKSQKRLGAYSHNTDASSMFVARSFQTDTLPDHMLGMQTACSVSRRIAQSKRPQEHLAPAQPKEATVKESEDPQAFSFCFVANLGCVASALGCVCSRALAVGAVDQQRHADAEEASTIAKLFFRASCAIPQTATLAADLPVRLQVPKLH